MRLPRHDASSAIPAITQPNKKRLSLSPDKHCGFGGCTGQKACNNGTTPKSNSLTLMSSLRGLGIIQAVCPCCRKAPQRGNCCSAHLQQLQRSCLCSASHNLYLTATEPEPGQALQCSPPVAASETSSGPVTAEAAPDARDWLSSPSAGPGAVCSRPDI